MSRTCTENHFDTINVLGIMAFLIDSYGIQNVFEKKSTKICHLVWNLETICKTGRFMIWGESIYSYFICQTFINADINFEISNAMLWYVIYHMISSPRVLSPEKDSI